MKSNSSISFKIDALRKEELKRVCWQYKSMKREAADLITTPGGLKVGNESKGSRSFSDPVAAAASRREYLLNRINAIELCAKLAGKDCAEGLLYGVITRGGGGFETMRAKGKIYCGRRQYLQMKRKFFYLLDYYIVND